MSYTQLTPAQKWEQLTFADDFIFYKVLEKNLDFTQELLELLLDIKIDHIELSTAQKDCKVDYFSKGARFDVYVKDGTGRCFDIELQTSHFSDLAKRARYYQGVMDIDTLNAGDDYKNLKESYVVFLCLGDSIGNGLPVYTFRYRADEDTNMLLNDGTVNIFFNAKLYDKMKSQKMRSFFEFLCSQKADSAFTDRLAVLVERIKSTPQERKDYMMFEEIVQKRLEKNLEEIGEKRHEEGIEEGEQRKAIETAKNMFELNLTPEQIAECTGLPLEQVLELQKAVVTR